MTAKDFGLTVLAVLAALAIAKTANVVRYKLAGTGGGPAVADETESLIRVIYDRLNRAGIGGPTIASDAPPPSGGDAIPTPPNAPIVRADS